MKKLTFEQMAFSRASDAWCPVTGRAYGPNIARVHPERILASVGTAKIYNRFSESQGFVRYSDEPGCYDRPGEQTHVFTEQILYLDSSLSAIPTYSRGPCGDGLSQDGRPLEVFTIGTTGPSAEWFLIDTMIHGNEPDGILGTFAAFVTLAWHEDFAPLRDQYSLALMPCCNPDGYYLGQRNLDLLGPHPSGVDTGINLNRVWPWFWDEFIPTAGESKGDAPITCSLESAAMEAWRAPLGVPKKIAWALDQHATAGDGARYASRDRCFRNIDEDEMEKLWADWTTIRLLRAIQAKRVHEGPNPDLWINYFRSRWRPHWHSYLSTLSKNGNGGIPCCSFVGEHNKVPDQVVTADRETYKSASDYNFDHIIALALVAQGGITERKAAVLVEHEVGDNQVQNSDFADWNALDAEYRPSWWSLGRAEMEGSERSERHMEGNGRPARITVDVLWEIDSPNSCDDAGGNDLVFRNGSQSSGVLCARAPSEAGGVGVLAVYSCDFESNPVKLFEEIYTAAQHQQWRLGKSNPASSIYLVGLGSQTTPLDAVFTRYTLVDEVWSETVLVTHTDSLEDAGACLDHINGNLYIFGGKGELAVSPKIWKADCTALSETFTEVGTDLFGANYGMGSCFCEGGALDGMIVLVGGTSDGELGLAVWVFDTSDGSLTSYSVTCEELEPTYPPSIMHCAVVYDGASTIWFYGGEHPGSGDVYHSTWSFKWNGIDFDEVEFHTLTAGLSDDGDPEDYSGDEEWIRPFRYWRGLRVRDPDTGKYVHMLWGGLERLSDGMDEDDLAMRRGFYSHYTFTSEMGRPADYNYGYMRYNTHFDISPNTKMAVSWSVRAETVNDDSYSASYARLNNAPGDSVLDVTTTRRVRTYYMHPPQWWWRENASIDTQMKHPLDTEDEMRLYIRGYRQAHTILADAPMVQMDTLWPSSWSPYGVTRAVETATWANTLDPRWFRVQIDWLPAAPFTALSSDMKLLTVGGDEGGHFGLWVINPDDNQREYNRRNVVGTSEPVLRLIRTVGAEEETVDIPCYWGGHIRDIAQGRFDSPIQIEIWNHSEYGSGLVVRNGWAEGWARIPIKTVLTEWATLGGVIAHGGGWWSEPQMLEMDRVWCNKYVETSFPQGALLIGDRDPTSGQVSARGTFRYSDNFTRADLDNLGDNWNVMTQTYSGWNISSNKARCEGMSTERWIGYPYLRDCSVFAEVTTPNGGKVGLFTRLDWTVSAEGFPHGYCGHLECTGATTGNLVITRYYVFGEHEEGTEVLATQAVTYNAGVEVTLELEALGSSITLTMSGAHTGTVTVVDTDNLLPGAVGLYGESSGEDAYVWADNFRVSASAGTKLRITE
jgi:hypothetical protein